ncbi:MAG: APC family permease [Acidimicrobiaceae bacterium]|nr:APC family permease [Acidimicrobiaceae bacterium]
MSGRLNRKASQKASPAGSAQGLKQSLHVRDLVALSVSSVGPLFSIAATGGVMAENAGLWTLPAIAIIAIPFIIGAFVFRLLNKHFPHAGASYHWSARVLGGRASRFQAWVMILAYFTSIPPIIIPASTYSLNLLFPGYKANAIAEVAMALFWSLFALVPLLRGARPTAKLTQVFLAIELVSVAAIVVIAILRWHAIAVPIHFGKPPIGGMIVTAVVAATILDGWEIDSYASEESNRPKSDPGIGGIIGAFMALGFYALIYPLMFGETPLHLLAGATNPMAVWGNRLVPGAPWLILVPVLASTAGGLWLTSFILTRALYAMGREGLVPVSFSMTNRRSSPSVATIVTIGAAFSVTLAQTLFSSLNSFFGLVLSAAGFFLVLEFFLDSVTATVFLRRFHKGTSDQGTLQQHHHRLLTWLSGLATVMFFGFMLGFVFYGPRAIGSQIDYVIAIGIILGFVFVRGTSRHKSIYYFHGADAQAADSQLENGKDFALDSECEELIKGVATTSESKFGSG